MDFYLNVETPREAREIIERRKLFTDEDVSRLSFITSHLRDSNLFAVKFRLPGREADYERYRSLVCDIPDNVYELPAKLLNAAPRFLVRRWQVQRLRRAYGWPWPPFACYYLPDNFKQLPRAKRKRAVAAYFQGTD